MVGIVPIEGDAHDSGDWEDPTNGPLGELFEGMRCLRKISLQPHKAEL
jgi:hypothetical protein